MDEHQLCSYLYAELCLVRLLPLSHSSIVGADTGYVNSKEPDYDALWGTEPQCAVLCRAVLLPAGNTVIR
jgi:hypothetical protein